VQPRHLARSCAAGEANPFDFACAQAFSMCVAASGVLQSVSQWSPSTTPMRLAAASAGLRNAALRLPMPITRRS
jgi:hypothetical protein